MNTPNLKALIIDVLVQESPINYSRMLTRVGKNQRWKLGIALHELIKDGIIYRSEAGLYSLSKDSARALAA
jgi:hypothetical protein